MPLLCQRCSHNNPDDALFCHHDGAPLGDPSRRQGAADPARKRFPTPLVYPSGRQCNTFDEVALAIQNSWNTSREMLCEGVFAGFFGTLGRADLAKAARDVARQPDADRALDSLLRLLPSGVIEAPRLEAEPASINLGTLRVGRDVRFDLHLTNAGMGLLTGEVSIEGGPWLVLGDGDARSRTKLFQTLNETTLPVVIRGGALAGGPKAQAATLVVASNGGRLEIPVTIEVPVTPFAAGPLAGATTPRQVAQKARDNPKEAAALFAEGAVERWYKDNGWIYPVTEPSAVGLAAVQQFFEALGLTTPPKVTVTPDEIRLEGKHGESLRATIRVTAEEKKPVFAHATTDAAWLAVSEVELDGRHATVRLRVAEVPDAGGDTLTGHVRIVTNGRARFKIPVHLTVTGLPPVVQLVEDEIPEAALVEIEPPPKPKRKRRRDRDESRPQDNTVRYALAAVPVGLLFLGLMTVFAVDLRAWVGRPRDGDAAEFASLPRDLSVRFHDGIEQADDLPDWEPTMRFGLALGPGKRLTFHELGLTNNTVLKIDGRETIFGEDRPGRWLERGTPARGLVGGKRCVWAYDDSKVQVTQTVGLAPGAQSGRIDTCYIHYRIENRDTRRHQVGLRFLLDTLIGGNDGVPFLIPGSSQLCNTVREFGAAAVPDYIQARETENFQHPGTVAVIQLKVPGLEPPAHVTLGAWPDNRLGGVCRDQRTLWLVPPFSMKSLRDSAVTIYWGEKPLEPGQSREVGFAYGLGSLASGEAGGALALSVGGSFAPNGEFTLTAEALNPTPGQTLTLELPEGFALSGGQATLPVPPVPAGAASRISPVSWRIKSGTREGEFNLRVRSSGGATQSRKVKIQVRGIFGN